jgi:hypothetical protein
MKGRHVRQGFLVGGAPKALVVAGRKPVIPRGVPLTDHLTIHPCIPAKSLERLLTAAT